MEFKILISFFLLQTFLSSTNSKHVGNGEKLLSRKRRYLAFPEGSSLQLVFCLTMPTIGMGKIFTIGTTAAMAWELPHDPTIFFEKKVGKLSHKVDLFSNFNDSSYQYNSNPILKFGEYYSPTIEKNSDPFYSEMNDDYSRYYNFQRYQLPNRQYNGDLGRKQYEPSFYYVEPEHIHTYRRTRRDLYGKLQKLLTALGNDGRACILKLICEVSQVANRKGSFMEEIVKVIFRIKTHTNMKDEDDYDAASSRTHDCNQRYKTCPASFFWKMIVATKNK